MIFKNKKFKIYILKYKLHKLKREREQKFLYLADAHYDIFSRVDSLEKVFPDVFNPIDIEIGRTQRVLERLKKYN
jgi:hypothetical protein